MNCRVFPVNYKRILTAADKKKSRQARACRDFSLKNRFVCGQKGYAQNFM